MSDNKKPALLYLTPGDAIVFEGPFNRVVRKTVVIENPRKIQSVSFKLRATTPEMFFLHPNTGLLAPGEKVTVEVFLKPIDGDFDQQSLMLIIQAAVVFRADHYLQGCWKVQEGTLWTAKIKCELENHYVLAGGFFSGFEAREEEQISISDNREIKIYGYQNFFKFFMFIPIMAAAFLAVFYGNQ
ncbi:vesicle-associated membrane protein-associated protein A-like [Drosophila kikkawai]|uniref:Vesicle-associated membrane protein-associated protein A-like n=1 Tax=Drosophila kikkawai TaxID=30033 RepID=A0A6P4J9X8_DROKI|nr:uncharacterized protein LOC108085992 [Drosophila kikkawai]